MSLWWMHSAKFISGEETVIAYSSRDTLADHAMVLAMDNEFL
jgi:hypothetical protein